MLNFGLCLRVQFPLLLKIHVIILSTLWRLVIFIRYSSTTTLRYICFVRQPHISSRSLIFHFCKQVCQGSSSGSLTKWNFWNFLQTMTLVLALHMTPAGPNMSVECRSLPTNELLQSSLSAGMYAGLKGKAWKVCESGVKASKTGWK